KDSNDEVVTYTATDTSQSDLAITETAQVDFHNPVSAATSSVVASPTSVLDNGSATSTITVTLEDSSDTPIPGQVVSLGQGGAGSTITAVSATTNAEGVATFTAKDSNDEVVTYTATDTSQSDLAITETAQVDFHNPVSAATSSVVASPTSVLDNGSATSTITVTLEDSSDTPIPGQVVSLGQGGAGSTITAVSATTNAEGAATSTPKDSTDEVVTYTATDTSQSDLAITETAQVDFHNPVSAATSSVVASPTSVLDNGSATSTITVTLEDSSDTPIPGQVVSLGQGGAGSTITAVSA